MIIVLIRTVIIYLMVLFAIRVMGKSELAAMEPFQLTVTLMIADLAVVPIESSDTSLFNGIAAIIALLFVQVLVSFATLKSDRLRAFICGSPSVVIKDGEVDTDELKSLRISSQELTEQLRIGGIDKSSDVRLAVVETNGSLSILLKDNKSPLTKSDFAELSSLSRITNLIYKGDNTN